MVKMEYLIGKCMQRYLWITCLQALKEKRVTLELEVQVQCDSRSIGCLMLLCPMFAAVWCWGARSPGWGQRSRIYDAGRAVTRLSWRSGTWLKSKQYHVQGLVATGSRSVQYPVHVITVLIIPSIASTRRAALVLLRTTAS